MFFLDVAISGAYFPFFSLHLSKTLGLTPGQVAAVYAMGPLSAFIGPPLMGAVADRVLAAEHSLWLVGTLRAAMLLLAARATSFHAILLSMALVGLFSAPAGVLSFSIAFHHSRKAHAIGATRVWGTVSWIFALWLTSAYMHRFKTTSEQLAHTRFTLLFAAAISCAGACYALTLPHTPPARNERRALAFVDALGLLRDPSFRALIVACALASACLQFHFMLWPLFYTDAKTGLGLDLARAGWLSSIAQCLELVLFPLLGLLIARFGLRRVLCVGILAWPLRFFAYAAGRPQAFVVGMQALHGVNVVLGTIAAQIAVDRVAPRGARASSQALLITATSGAGNLLGQLSCGAVLSASALAHGGYAWPSVFALPLGIGVLASGILIFGFRPRAEDIAAQELELARTEAPNLP